MAVKKKKVAAKRKPSKLLTPAQVYKKKDAIQDTNVQLKEDRATLREQKANLIEAMKTIRPIQHEVKKLEKKVGALSLKIEQTKAEING